MQERCIQEVTNDLVENQMELEYKESDQEIEEIEVMDNYKLVDVIHKFEQIKAMAITSMSVYYICTVVIGRGGRGKGGGGAS